MSLPVKGVAYSFSVGLSSAANPAVFLANPTITVGDFKVSIDGAAFANLATAPVVTPAGSRTVLIALSSTEMNGSKVNVQGVDVAGNEWQEILIEIDVPDNSIETAVDVIEGDRIETSTSLRINRKGTVTEVLDKTIGGSLLNPGVTITTVDAP